MGQAPPGSAYNDDQNGWPLIAGAGDFSDGRPTPAKFTTKATRLSKKGDIILAIRASIGEKVIADDTYCLGRGVAALRPRENLCSRYLWHCLGHARQQLEGRGRGATFRQVNREDIASLELPLLTWEDQRRIADILDRADELRVKRRRAIEQLETLKQSIFLDMFGHPRLNPKGLEMSALGDLIKLSSGDSLPATKMNPGPYPVYGGNGISGYHDEFRFEAPQIVIGRVGAYCGAVHTSSPRSWITDNALYVKERSPDLEFEYLAWALRIADLNQYSSQFGQPLVSGSRIYPVSVMVPPTGDQLDFAERLRLCDRLGGTVKQSASDLQLLFESVQASAFAGAL